MGFHLLSTGRAQLSEEEKAPSPDPNLSRFSKGSVLHAPPNELVPLPESALNFFFWCQPLPNCEPPSGIMCI